MYTCFKNLDHETSQTVIIMIVIIKLVPIRYNEK
jgi:hypothetical protein